MWLPPGLPCPSPVRRARSPAELPLTGVRCQQKTAEVIDKLSSSSLKLDPVVEGSKLSESSVAEVREQPVRKPKMMGPLHCACWLHVGLQSQVLHCFAGQ